MKELNKDWWKSKSVWVAIVGVGIAICQALGLDISPSVYALLGSVGLYSVRDAQGLKYKNK